MSEHLVNNKRIAKNTMLLYFRMLVMMLISLYTSRVILKTLGVEDYGIYNVVGGIVAMFGFITGPMAGTTQRYITFALGKGNPDELKNVFCTCINIYMVASVVLIILCETIGLWFLYNKMQIPTERMGAAFWVLQFSLSTTVVMLMTIPYNADIIAHEKMSAFAYISILESSLKLAIVFVIQVASADRLVLYAVFMLIVQSAIATYYIIYCIKHFRESKYTFVYDKSLTREMTGFAGWSLFGNLAAMGSSQGVNMLLNVFFGPVVNAARGISVQVQSAVSQFVNNFQTALNPQITKSYASGDYGYMFSLVNKSSRFSFYLVYLLSLPFLIETSFILNLWLGQIPEYTVIFLRLILVVSWKNALVNPLVTVMLATGRIKRYQQVLGFLLLLTLPISYFALELGYPPYTVFIVQLTIEIIAHIIRLYMLKSIVGMPLHKYYKTVLMPIFLVVLTTLIPAYIMSVFSQGTFATFVYSCVVCTISGLLAIFLFGVTNQERRFILDKVLSKIKVV